MQGFIVLFIIGTKEHALAFHLMQNSDKVNEA